LNLAEEIAKKWGEAPPKKKKKTKKKPEKIVVVEDPVKFDEELKKVFIDEPAEYDSELHEKATVAKLEQEISKAETMKYKAEQERLKLKRAAGEVMEFDKGDLLFFGFIDKCSLEILRVMDKFEPVIKNLTAENDYKSIILTVNRELENVLTNIQEEQNTAVDDWRKEFK
jgi:hypothetical protein